MDLFDDGDRTGDNAPEYTVSEISGAVKRVIEGGFSRIRVRGEVSRVSRPRSGHLYFDLKDDRSVLAGVVWKGQAARLAAQPEEGLEVVATGRLTTFPGQSRYQMVIDSLAPAGVGALMAMLEKRKKALEAEGLFAPDRKRPLPYLPEVIGVVTSPSGAVIRDILHRLRERFPRKVLVWPVAVQGDRCAPDVARAIEGFNRLTPGGALPRPDLLIVARGGGSIEDLWGFNEEIVVRAAAASRIPLISAVGHETDTTLVDFAADRRAPTPTAAAEMAVPVRAELLAWTGTQGARLTAAATRGLGQRGQRLRDLARALPRPEELTQGPAQRLDHLAERLPRALKARLGRLELRLGKAAAVLRPATLAAQARVDRRRVIETDRRLAAALRLRRSKAEARLRETGPRLVPAFRSSLGNHRIRLTRSAARLSLRPVRIQIARLPGELRRVARRLGAAEQALLGRSRDRLAGAGRLLETLSYGATLARGYAVIWGAGTVVTSAEAARAQPLVEIEFRDGRLPVRPAESGPPAGPATPRQRRKRGGAGQKSLFDE
ncbi:MAG: exodeoxyribonuclease VII large subunit [Rhodobacteraceae bacterium]|nr:exodeoxyribonuclease VII large subunit [Paracoccaceae bacterium]